MQIDRILGNVGVLYVGAYNSSIQYEYLNCVTYNGSSYVCVNQNGVTGVEPGTTDDWQLSAKKGDVGPVGPKPVNGVDYNTDEEKEEFKNDVVSKATEEVEKNLADIETEAIENYNKNATQKITEYNTNANTQVENFNTNATSKTNDFNSNASTKTEEFNAVADAEKEQFAVQTEAINHHIAVVSDELERVKNDVLETGTDTDTFIHLEDSAMAEYQELSVDGVCEQETTSGKNLLNIENNSISETLTNVAINNHEIKFTTIANSQYEQTIFFKNILLKANKTYSIMRIKSSEVPSTMGQLELYKGSDWIKVILDGMVNSGTFTVSEDDIYAVRIKLSNANQPSYTGTISNIMISEEGGEYEPYTGGQPSPNPDYPQEIKTIENSLKITSCNKNLWNVDNIEIGAIDQNGVFVNSDVRARAYYQKIQNNDRITISSGISDLSVVPYFYDKNKKFITYNDGWKTMPCTFDIVKDAKYVAFLFRNSSNTINLDELTQIQLEPSPTATEYEQRLQSQITANLPEGEFIGKIDDTHKDTLKVEYNEEDGQYHLMLYKMLKKYTFTGNENIALNNTSSDYIEFIISNLSLNPSNFLPTVSNYFLYNLNNRIAISNNSGIYIRVPVECEIDTVDKFKTFLLSNEVYVYYVLATPYILDLGIVDMPLTYNEITNLFTDSDLMPTINAKYYRNFTKTIADLQVNNKSLLEELTDLETKVTTLESNNADLESRVLALENKEISTTSLESEVK